MKTLTFYEANELATHVPPQLQSRGLSDIAQDVFDVVNNVGALTERGLQRKLGDYLPSEIRQALSQLREAGLIERRTLEAHDTD